MVACRHRPANHPDRLNNSMGIPDETVSRIRLAVVDDHAIIRGVFVTLVEDADDLTIAWTASCLSEAMEQLQLDPPDMLVMDVHLPDGSGFDFTREVLQWKPELPVLMVSAFHDKTHSERAAACGACGYIPKEASLEKLVEAVQTVQHGGRWF